MSNQRPATTHRAAMADDNKVSLKAMINLIEECEQALEKDEKEDAAYYFSQLKEFITKEPHKIFNYPASKILGL